jgi:sec-independent protein translocase protein TatA
MGLGTGEIILILIIVLLLFGAKRLPELARSLGKSLREFKKAASDIQEEIQDSLHNLENPTESPKKEESTPKPHDQKE